MNVEQASTPPVSGVSQGVTIPTPSPTPQSITPQPQPPKPNLGERIKGIAKVVSTVASGQVTVGTTGASGKLGVRLPFIPNTQIVFGAAGGMQTLGRRSGPLGKALDFKGKDTVEVATAHSDRQPTAIATPASDGKNDFGDYKGGGIFVRIENTGDSGAKIALETTTGGGKLQNTSVAHAELALTTAIPVHDGIAVTIDTSVATMTDFTRSGTTGVITVAPGVQLGRFGYHKAAGVGVQLGAQLAVNESGYNLLPVVQSVGRF